MHPETSALPRSASLLLLIALPLTAWGDRLDETIAVPASGVLEVDLDLGDGLRPDPGSIEVTAHDAPQVRLLANPTGWGASGVTFTIDRDVEGLRVYGRVEGAISWLFGGPSVTLRIWVPRHFSVDLRSTAAAIRVEDVRGNVSARTGDAEIEVVGTEGKVSIRVGQGDVRVSEVVGDVRVRSSQGDIELDWIRGEVRARTGAGEIAASRVDGPLTVRSQRGGIELADVRGPVQAKTERGSVFVSFTGDPRGELETRRGQIEIAIPKEAAAQLDAEALGGSVEVAAGLPFESREDRGRTTGTINGGGDVLRLYTARGEIRVRGR